MKNKKQMERILKVTEDFISENPLLRYKFKANDELHFGNFPDIIFYDMEVDKNFDRSGVVVLKTKDDASKQSASIPFTIKDKYTLYSVFSTNYPTRRIWFQIINDLKSVGLKQIY